jgi:nitrogen-specific signal transduction histidine kinase
VWAYLNEDASHLFYSSPQLLFQGILDRLIKTGKGGVRLVKTDASWFGVTFKEDADLVRSELDQLTAEEGYPRNLWFEVTN